MNEFVDNSPTMTKIRARAMAECDRMAAAGHPSLAAWARESPQNFRTAMKQWRGTDTRAAPSRPARRRATSQAPGGAHRQMPSWHLPTPATLGTWRL